jgi:hypothetical protein
LDDRLLDSKERRRMSKRKKLRGIFGPKKERHHRRLDNTV